jgi:hypothetical protein
MLYDMLYVIVNAATGPEGQSPHISARLFLTVPVPGSRSDAKKSCRTPQTAALDNKPFL